MIRQATTSSIIFSAIASATLLLAACAKPTTAVPKATQAEIDRERNWQMKDVHGKVAKDYAEVEYSKTEINAMTERMQRIVNKLSPEATKLCREMNGPEANCNMIISLAQEGKGVNAHADGEKIVIYPAMIDFTTNDNHLAFVIAHEYTHHMLEHVSSSQQNVLTGAILGTLADALASSQGVNTSGQLGKLGAQASILTYSPEFEHEADYVGAYMLARAGFKLDNVPDFWREMSQNNPKGIYTRTTHPTTPERYVALRKAIEEIRDKQRRKQPLRPNMVVEN
ncbi:MAG: M48 family metalloprotease [Rickettsiales bacterium]|nr:M48 family metalloprotease [Rickettsiales bacterium]